MKVRTWFLSLLSFVMGLNILVIYVLVTHGFYLISGVVFAFCFEAVLFYLIYKRIFFNSEAFDKEI